MANYFGMVHIRRSVIVISGGIFFHSKSDSIQWEVKHDAEGIYHTEITGTFDVSLCKSITLC